MWLVIAVGSLVVLALTLGWWVVSLRQQVEKLHLELQAKNDLIAVTSHELKTPITAARGFLDLIILELKNENLPPQIAQEVAKARHILEQALNLVKSLLEMSAIERGKIKVECQPLDIRPLVQNITDELQSQAQEKDLSLFLTVPTTPGQDFPFVLADSDRLEQVIINLVNNAIKYTPQGQVEIELLLKPQRLQIAVKDTGLGLTDQEQSELFTKFYRVKNKDTQKISGSGLGLWISKQLVELMGGRISLESAPNQGSTFFVEIPIVSKSKFDKETA